MSVATNKLMNLGDGQVLYNNLRDKYDPLIPTNTGTEGQVLRCDGAGGVEWDDNASAEEIASEVTSWLDDHVTQGETLVVDNSLSVSGAAADAKVAGDEISSLKSAIDDIEDVVAPTVTLSPVWERGNINSSGADSGSARFVRSTEMIPVYADSIHVEYDGSYTSYPLYNVYKYKSDGTFDSVISKGASADIPITYGYKVRFVICTGSQDTTTTIPVEDGDDILQASYKAFRNLQPDTTLTQSNRPADAKAVGDAISDCENVEQSMSMEWERGKLSSTGTNSSSTSTKYIRNGYRYQINTNKIHLAVPTGVTVELHGYSTIYGLNYIEKIGTYTSDSDVAITSGTYIRLVAYYTNNADIALSVGDSVVVSYKTNLQDAFDDFNRNKLNDYSCLSMFETVGVIGDSWASGSIHTPGGYVDTDYSMSWGQIIARKNGITVTNYSQGGLSTKTWLSNNTYGLSKLLSDNPLQLYIINLGINDNTQINEGTLTLGTVADVNVSDYTQNPDTFFGDYGRIIGNIKAHAPKAIIIMLSVARPNERNMDTYIKQIADKYELPYIQLTDDEYFISGYFYGSIYDGHMSVYGYSGMANAIQRLIQRHIIKNRLMYAYYDGSTE